MNIDKGARWLSRVTFAVAIVMIGWGLQVVLVEPVTRGLPPSCQNAASNSSAIQIVADVANHAVTGSTNTTCKPHPIMTIASPAKRDTAQPARTLIDIHIRSSRWKGLRVRLTLHPPERDSGAGDRERDERHRSRAQRHYVQRQMRVNQGAPPSHAPPALPRLNAAMLSVEASIGDSRAWSTTRICRPGTVAKAATPQTNTVSTAAVGCVIVTESKASTRASATRMPSIDCVGFQSARRPPNMLPNVRPTPNRKRMPDTAFGEKPARSCSIGVMYVNAVKMPPKPNTVSASASSTCGRRRIVQPPCRSGSAGVWGHQQG